MVVAISLLVPCLIGLAVWALAPVPASGESTVSRLQPGQAPKRLISSTAPPLKNRIVAIESRWNRSSTEVIRFEWSSNTIVPDSETVHYLKLDDRFREHIFVRFGDGNSMPKMKIRQWDGKLFTTIVPSVEVVRREGITPAPPTSQPYGVILKELGFAGTLEQFVSEEAKSRLFDTELRVGNPGNGIVRIERRSRLSGAAMWDVIELTLDSENELRLLSGRAYELSASDEIPGPETVVSVTHQSSDENTLRYDVTFTSSSQLRQNAITIRVNAEPLEPDVTFEQIRVRELFGNPIIRHYDENGKVSLHQFRPSKEPPKEPWPVFDQWLLINDVFLALFVVVIVTQLLIRRFSSKQLASDVPTPQG